MCGAVTEEETQLLDHYVKEKDKGGVVYRASRKTDISHICDNLISCFL